MSNEVGDSYLAWVSLFPSTKLQRIYNIQSLGRLDVILELLQDIDSKSFNLSQLGISQHDINSSDFVVKLNALKRIMEEIQHYYFKMTENQLPRNDPNIVPSLSQIILKQDQAEIVKLIRLIIVLSVVCERKEIYVERIQTFLSPEIQTTIMHTISPILSGNFESIQVKSNSTSDLDRELSLEGEIAKLLAERNNWSEKHAIMKQQIDSLTLEISNLKDSIPKTPTNDVDSSKLQNENSHLTEHISQLEHNINQQKDSIQEYEKALRELSHVSGDNEKLSQRIDELNQSLEISNQQILRLQKIENVAQRYKRKLEDSRDLALEFEALKQENANLRQAIDSTEKLVSTPNKVEHYSTDRMAELEATELSQRTQIVDLQHALNSAEARLSRDHNLINSLESRAENISNAEGEIRLKDDLASAITIDSKVDVTPAPQRAPLNITKLISTNQELKEKVIELANQSDETFRMTLFEEMDLILKTQAKELNQFVQIQALDPTKDENVKEYRSREAEIENLKMELEVMSSAWYSLASRVQMQNVVVMRRTQDSPKGWLNRQRKVLDRIY